MRLRPGQEIGYPGPPVSSCDSAAAGKDDPVISDFEHPPIQSAVPGLCWPALPGASAEALLALLYQLERSQWWAEDILREQQFRQLNALLDHALTTVPYYRQRLGAAGLQPGAGVDPGQWREIPVLTRAEVQAAGTSLHSNALPPGHGPVFTLSSSGSTGRPIEAAVTRLRQLFWEAITVREHLWQRRDAGGKLATIRLFPQGQGHYPQGLEAASWGGPVAALYRTGPVAGLSLASSVAEQAEWLARQSPDYLLNLPGR